MFVVANLHYLIHWPMKSGYKFVSGPLADITLIVSPDAQPEPSHPGAGIGRRTAS